MRAQSETLLTPSVFDRLMEDRDGGGDDYDLEDLKTSVARDLANLLNTMRSPPEFPIEAAEAERSVLAYGLPDMTAFNPRSERDHARLVSAMESAVRLFEPRLSRPRIELLGTDPLSGHLRFRLDAMLKVHPRPVAVTFDTVLQPVTKTFAVEED